jgi:hypothetical protein
VWRCDGHVTQRRLLTQVMPFLFACKAEIHKWVWSATRHAQILRDGIVTVHRHATG